MTRIYLLTAFLALAVSGLFAQKQQQQSFEAYITAADQAAQRDNHYLAYRFYSLAERLDQLP